MIQVALGLDRGHIKQQIMAEAKIPYVFHLWYQDRLMEQFGRYDKVSKKDAMTFLHKYKIPKPLWPIILEEMRQLGLVEYVDRLHLRIINYKQGYIHNTGKILLSMGVEPA